MDYPMSDSMKVPILIISLSNLPEYNDISTSINTTESRGFTWSHAKITLEKNNIDRNLENPRTKWSREAELPLYWE